MEYLFRRASDEGTEGSVWGKYLLTIPQPDSTHRTGLRRAGKNYVKIQRPITKIFSNHYTMYLEAPNMLGLKPYMRASVV